MSLNSKPKKDSYLTQLKKKEEEAVKEAMALMLKSGELPEKLKKFAAKAAKKLVKKGKMSPAEAEKLYGYKPPKKASYPLKKSINWPSNYSTGSSWANDLKVVGFNTIDKKVLAGAVLWPTMGSKEIDLTHEEAVPVDQAKNLKDAFDSVYNINAEAVAMFGKGDEPPFPDAFAPVSPLEFETNRESLELFVMQSELLKPKIQEAVRQRFHKFFDVHAVCMIRLNNKWYAASELPRLEGTIWTWRHSPKESHILGLAYMKIEVYDIEDLPPQERCIVLMNPTGRDWWKHPRFEELKCSSPVNTQRA